jgi:hypothetical protein
MARGVKRISFDLTTEAFEALKRLTRTPAMQGCERYAVDLQVSRVAAYLACSAADGVRRPGAWERGWVEQAFGPVPDDDDASEVG